MWRRSVAYLLACAALAIGGCPSGPTDTLDTSGLAGTPGASDNPDASGGGSGSGDLPGGDTSSPDAMVDGETPDTPATPDEPETPLADPIVPAAVGQVFLGDVACTVTQTLNESATAPKQDTLEIEIGFDNQGEASGHLVFGFSGSPDVTAPIIQVGQSTTEKTTSNNLSITMGITIREADYSDDSFRLVFDVDYRGEGGSLVQDGAGVLTVEGVIANGTLSYTAEMEYDVEQSAGSLTFQTGETRVCQGELALQ